MHLTDAHWERRNLGVSCQELTVERGDTASDVLAAVDRLNSQYQVVKVPAGDIELMGVLSQRGFSFIEGSVRVEHPLRRPVIPPVVQRLADKTRVLRVPESEIDRVITRVHRGMFDTDRVFLDERFSPGQAARRYSNWIIDEVDRGAGVYELSYADNPVGFFLFREGSGSVGFSALSGLYDRVSTPGMGFVLLYLTLEEGVKRGLKRLDSTISTNNLAVVKTHAVLGFSVVDIQYVYVRHGQEGSGVDGEPRQV